ncbi:RNA polymerase sigma factor [Paenibacillus macerans]|uniref:RNA polymerase sigma factor n=1 Tax=Paenibacillus macerans TaxID=44252 RepID=UPI000EF0C49C|nr:sigma-70 family RNA polymerase sigma factor [Paenibacillus macerans]GBK60780.1 RNA polymerase subunit sigma-24 [Paenibacillus macerans]GBK67080.1 RNA polymerase subunit sigma-24 [Paenibacillus macerans]
MDLQNEEMTRRLREMCGGSVQAFDAFYAEFSPFVMQVASRLVGERMEAEDVCHEVFIEVLRRGKDYDPARGSIKAWLAVMTRSRSLDRMRRKARLEYPGDEALQRKTEEAGGSGEDEVLSRLEREAIRTAIYTLPESQKKAIMGSYYALQTQRQMSEAWSVPIGTVKSWVRYGLHNLRKQLEKQGWVDQLEGGNQHDRTTHRS